MVSLAKGPLVQTPRIMTIQAGQAQLVTQVEPTDACGEEGCGTKEKGRAWSLIIGVEEEVADTLKVEGRGH